MSDDQTAADDESEEYQDIPLTETARYAVTLGTTFTWRGNSHWPKVKVEDGAFLLAGEDGTTEFESTESLIYRVEETAHRRLYAVVQRMKHDIDQRASDEAALRAARGQAAAASASEK